MVENIRFQPIYKSHTPQHHEILVACEVSIHMMWSLHRTVPPCSLKLYGT